MSTGRTITSKLSLEQVGFMLANRIPRNALTCFMGWFSKVEFAPVRAVSLAVWKAFCKPDLSDARESEFRSLHDAFTRRIRPDARPVNPNPDLMTSPCDALIGAFGKVEGGMALQIKGMPYAVVDLFGSAGEAAQFEGGTYMTLRLTPGMYHRFHAPHDIVAEQLRYISGDKWSVNPPALKRIERLFCKNERAPLVVRVEATGHRFVLVPVAAVLVASIRLPWLDGLHSIRKGGSRMLRFEHKFSKGDEMGWFEHGSTIVMFAPPEWQPLKHLNVDDEILMGEPLFEIAQ